MTQPPLLTLLCAPDLSPDTPAPKRFCRVTAPSTQTLQELHAKAHNAVFRLRGSTAPHLQGRTAVVCLPSHPEQYNSKLYPSLRVDADYAPEAEKHLHVPSVPNSYWRVAYLLNRQHIFLSLADERFFAEPLARAGLRARILLWHSQKLRRAVVDLLVAYDWEDDPAPGTPIAMLNAYMAAMDLGRQRHLQFSSNPGARRLFRGGTTPQQRQARSNPLVQHAHALSPEERCAYLAANPGTAWLYAKAYPQELV